MKPKVTPCASRGSVALDVQAALRDLNRVAATVRLGRIAKTVAAKTGHTAADVERLLNYTLAEIEEGLVDEDSKSRRKAGRLLRKFQELLEVDNRIARCERFLQRANGAGNGASHPSKTPGTNDLKRLANSGGPSAR
jgi:hypothetical protein